MQPLSITRRSWSAPLRAWLFAAAVFTAPTVAQAPAPSAFTDPRQGVMPLPCAEGWQASLVLDRGDVGIWTVKAFQVFPNLGTPEVVGLDDKGRCWILVHYSGKWTPMSTIEEGEWLGGLAHGDVDPRAAGAELYTGGKKGNLYQVRAYPFGATDHRLIARFPGEEVHTLLSGDLDPRVQGAELLVFTSPGALYRVAPTGADGTFETVKLCDTPGRVRDAIRLPPREGAGVGGGEVDGQAAAHARVATVARSGELCVLEIGADGPAWTVVHSAPVGRGRLALAPSRAGRGVVLYTTQDDGVILRHEERATSLGTSDWSTEVIYRGPLGPRGVKAGHFDVDPNREQVMVFGYSGKVELLSRDAGVWSAEVVFEDRAGGHWLDTLEIDSRNGTDELIGSGYGGRIFMLSRPPGYGCEPTGAALLPTDSKQAAAPAPVPARALAQLGERAAGSGGAPVTRSLFIANGTDTRRLDPLRYNGGFQAKTALHETLVQRDASGRFAPGLASDWSITDDGRGYTLRLRDDARWSDGRAVTAAEVVAHFRRVIGLPEHAWLRGLARVEALTAPSEREVCFALREPWPLLADLCAINPCAVRGPGTLDGSGEYVSACGSGPWRYRALADGGARVVLEAARGPARTLELTSIPPVVVLGVESNAALDALRNGTVDVLADGWHELVPRASFAAERARATASLCVPGSSVWYLSFRLAGPTASRPLRRALAASIDRDGLVRDVELGYAEPCFGWAAPGVTAWPASRAPEAEPVEVVPRERLRCVASDNEREAALARALTAQLRAAGFDVELQVVGGAALAGLIEAGAYDMRLERTWGVPYDPDLSLQARFLPATASPSAAAARDFGVDPELRRLVTALVAATDDARRIGLETQIQRHIEAAAPIVPLYAPMLLGLARNGARLPEVGLDLYRTAW
ncbi:MAG: ABC transporter substrate-binding protein [Planctomycetota bacterium]